MDITQRRVGMIWYKQDDWKRYKLINNQPAWSPLVDGDREEYGNINGLLVDITYANLVTAMWIGTLIPGMKYRITDYATSYRIGATNPYEYATGDVEPLIVTATSTTELSQHAISETNPQDLITFDVNDNAITSNWYWYYDYTGSEVGATFLLTVTGANTFTVGWDLIFDNDLYLYWEDDDGVYFDFRWGDYWVEWTYVDLGWNVYEITLTNYTGDLTNITTWPNESGWFEFDSNYSILERTGNIIYRKDTVKMIETDYDFRAVTSRRWKIDLTGKTWVGWTSYALYDWVVYNQSIYMCIRDHATSETPTASNSSYWIKVLNAGNGYVLSQSTQQFWYCVFTADSLDYQDYHTFSDQNGDYYDESVYWYSSQMASLGWNYNVFIYGSTWYWPRIQGCHLWQSEGITGWNTQQFNWMKSEIAYYSIFEWTLTDVNIWYVSQTIIYQGYYFNMARLYNSTMISCQDIGWTTYNRIMLDWAMIINIGRASDVLIGRRNWVAQNITASNMAVVRALWMFHSVSYWYLYNCIFGWVNKVNFWPYFYNYTQDLSTLYVDLSETNFAWPCYSNFVYYSMSWNTLLNNFRWNYIYNQFTNNNIGVGCWNNYLDRSVDWNRFLTFTYNGTAWNHLKIAIQNNDILLLNNLNWESNYVIADNKLNILQSVTIAPKGRLVNNTCNLIQSVTINASWDLSDNNNVGFYNNCVINWEVKYNSWWRLQNCTMNNFRKNNIVGNILSQNFTSATHVAGDYSTTIMQCIGGGYNVCRQDISTWYNFDWVLV